MPATERRRSGAGSRAARGRVREAGALALSMFRTPIKQLDQRPVARRSAKPTSRSTRLLRERLSAAEPASRWLSEETEDDPARLDARTVWIVDPIDGTRAYLAGLPDWSVSVALVDDGRPVAGRAVTRRSRSEFFLAVAGEGATLQRRADRRQLGRGLRRRSASPARSSSLERLAAVAPPLVEMPRVHSLALRLARVAQGTLDVAFAGGNSHDWDLAAADLLVHEAGGALTPFGGGPVIYNCPVPRHGTLVAAGRDRHAALIDLLRDRRIASS